MINTAHLSHLLSAGLRASLWSFADQALISSSNFVIMVLLARQLGPKQFGAFVLAYTVLLFVNSIQRAIIIQPHSVLGAVRRGQAFAHYTMTSALLQMGISILCAVLISLGGLILLHFENPSGWIILTLAPVSVVWQFQEFARRVLYTQSDFSGAFLNDIIAYGGQVIATLYLWRINHLTPIVAVVAIGVTSLAGALIGAWQIRASIATKWRRHDSRLELRETWEFGRWLLGSSMSNWLSGQLYPVIVAGFVGVGTLGGMRASQNLIAPTQVLAMAFDTAMLPTAARAYSNGGISLLWKSMRRIAVPIFVVIAIYCLAISMLSNYLVVTLFGENFAPFSWLVGVYAFLSPLNFVNTSLKIYLRSAGKTLPLFYAQIVSVCFILTIGFFLVKRYGIYGAVVGMVIHILILVLVQGWYALRLRHSSLRSIDVCRESPTVVHPNGPKHQN